MPISAAGRILAALLLSTGAALPAAAQQPIGAPLRLAPPGAPDRPLPAAPPAATGTRPDSPASGAGTVEIAPLPATDPDSLGLPATAADGFGPGLWEGTSRDLAITLLQRLPNALTSPSLRALQRRLLQTAAKPPAGEAPPDGPRLIALRIAKLAEMGDSESVDALLRLIPPKLDDEMLLRVRVDQAFLADQREAACAEVSRQVSRFPNVFWQQAQVACQAAAGDAGAAGLGAQLLREQGLDNPGFFNLVDLAGGARNLSLDKLGPVTPAELPMLRAAKRDLPADSLAATSPGVLRALAVAPEIPVATRLAAGERAAATGALTTEALAQIYLAVEFAPADLANAAAMAKTDKTARARALLFKAARTQPATTRAELIRAAFDSARAAGLFLVSAQLYQPRIDEIAPTPELVWFAGDAARALLAAGSIEGARRWLELVQPRASADAEAGRIQAQLWPLFRLANGIDGPIEPAQLLGWYDAQGARQSAATADRAALVYGLLGALGNHVPSGAWKPLLAAPGTAGTPAGAAASPPLLLALSSAAGDGRVGEAVALAAIEIGAREPAGAGTLGCTELTAALRALRMTQAARRFALEAALSGGA